MARHSALAACLGTLAALIFPVESGATTSLAGDASSRVAFPEPAAMEHQVSFWTRVYVEIGTDAGFVHDDRLLGVVYESLKVSADRRSRERRIKARKRHWREVLKALAAGKAAGDPHARLAVQRLGKALGRSPTRTDFRAASRRLRFQRGQRDRFQEGLVRAGAFEGRFREIFASYGLPQDLAYLPHVESSFNTYAYSKLGAAGMWQFMRGTARRFLSMDNVVDERLEPIKATHAAARLLADNHRRLGRWPLAITAYNHGAAGMNRARKAAGSGDIAVIVERYSGRGFGFASRNFYAQFLAARRVARDYRKHFGPLELSKPAPVHVVALPFYADAKDLERHLGVSPRTLAKLNPSLRPTVFRSEKYIPKGFELRLPAALDSTGGEALLAAVPPGRRHDAQRPSEVHVVRRGDTLSHIAKRYGTSVARLVSMNDLGSRHRIRVGQKLELMTTRHEKSTRRAAVPAPAVVQRTAAAPPANKAPQRVRAVVPLKVASVHAAPPWRQLDGRFTTVDHQETLGHFADWLDLPSSVVRRLNGLSSRKALRMGQRIELDFSKVSAKSFLARRTAYHEKLEQAFLARRPVTDTVAHTLAEGENMWVVANDIYYVPVWLLHRFNPGAGLGRLSPGTLLTVPVLTPAREL